MVYLMFSFSPATLVNRLQFHFLGYGKIIARRTRRRIWGLGGAVGGNRGCLFLQLASELCFGNGRPKEEVRKDVTGKELVFFEGNSAFIANISSCLVAGIQLKTKQMFVKITGYSSQAETLLLKLLCCVPVNTLVLRVLLLFLRWIKQMLPPWMLEMFTLL